MTGKLKTFVSHDEFRECLKTQTDSAGKQLSNAFILYEVNKYEIHPSIRSSFGEKSKRITDA